MVVTLGVFFLSIVGLTLGTSCSDPERVANLNQCLQDIGGEGLSPDAFWFGNQYDINCPLGNGESKLECVNPLAKSSSKSIYTRLFPTGSSNPALLDRYLKMEFTSPPGNYTGCGNSFEFDSIWTQVIDPLGDVVVKPWYVRYLPSLEWTYTSDEMFTLVVYDVGSLFVHGVYTNIMGNDILESEVIKSYHGPLRTASVENPYAFMLFRQENQLNVSQEWRTRIQTNAQGNISFSELIDQWNLTGPVAINWIVATGDVYAAQRMLDYQITNMCPNFVAEGLNEMPRPFLPSSASLDVGVHVKFAVTPTDFTVCCGLHRYEQETFDLNPLGNPVYDTYKTSQTPTITLLKKGLLYKATNFAGDMYTLITVDPDVPIATVGTEDRPLLHWLVTNIADGNVNTGDVYKGYNGPQPPDRQAHYYYFLLYKQDSALQLSTILNYAGNCPERLLGRCLFNINNLVADQNLTLVGASWMTATTDIYVAKRQLGDGPNTDNWCRDMPGYGGDPECRVGASSRTLGSYVLMIVTLVLLLVS